MFDDPTQLFTGIVFGAIGMGYFIYGKKQRNGIAFLAGVALCAFPYLVSNLYLSILIGAALMALPCFVRV